MDNKAILHYQLTEQIGAGGMGVELAKNSQARSRTSRPFQNQM